MSPLLRRPLLAAPVAVLAASLVLLTPPAPAQPAKAKTYTFCWYNVENLFDDKTNPKLEKADREFDLYFSKDRVALETKLSRLCDVLLHKDLNGPQGPDLLALGEVESGRAVELLRDALNKRLKDKKLHYDQVVYKDPQGGRSIATALLARAGLKLKDAKLLGRLQRILKVRVSDGGPDLVVIASHWSSRISDARGTGRANYARTIHLDFLAEHKKDARVDYLVCGDFNDTPTDDAVVKSLHATGDVNKALDEKANPPLLFNPFAAFAGKKGTNWHQGKGYLFDQVCVSPGLLDGEGWSYVNKSAAIVEQLKFRDRPDRFGGPDDRRPWRNRGASDHFPVTIKLRAGGK